MTVAAARAQVEQEAQQRAVHIYIEFVTSGRVTAVRKFGRIRVAVRDNVVVSASG